jgi:hypothetical protein
VTHELVRPAELRAAALSLRAVQGRFTTLEARVAGCRQAEGTWLGAAAAVHEVRVLSLARGLGACAEPLGRVAEGVDRLATRAEAAHADQRRLEHRRTELLRERELVLAAPVDPDDAAGLTPRALALRRLEAELARIAAELDRLEDELEVGRRVLAAVLEDAPPPPLPPDLAALARLAISVAGALGGLRQIHRGVAILALSVRYARSVDLGARMLLALRIGDLLRLVERVPWWARRLGRLGLLAVPLTVLPSALPDVLTGGGHPGWRGVVTRASGVLAIAGSVAIAAPVPVPHIKAAGAIALGSYALWKAGSWTYDNRELVARLGGVAWAEAKRRAGELAELMRPTPLLPWGPLGPLPPLLGGGAGWDGLRDLLPEPPDDWRDLIPGGGDLPRLPDLPLGPVIRLPILPGPLGPRIPLPFDPFRWWS